MPRHLARALLLGILLTGCTETDSAATEHDSTVETVTPTRRPLTVTDVDLDAAVADLCVVRSSFEVDPTRIDDHEQSPWLAALASCITTGPLQGRSLELVAHTSIHHDSPYARRLGESRADSLRARLRRTQRRGPHRRASIQVSARHRPEPPTPLTNPALQPPEVRERGVS
jgi:hypothetical protein